MRLDHTAVPESSLSSSPCIQVVLAVNERPRGNGVSVSPMQGTALTTSFTVRWGTGEAL